MHQVRRPARLVVASAAAVSVTLLTGLSAAAGSAQTPGPLASWGTARVVPGTAALNQDGVALLVSVSCASAGNCGAGGYYTDIFGHQQAFVVSETNGTWRNAEEVPGTAALNQDGNAYIASVSCASAGNCSAGGFYTDGSPHQQAFVVSQTNGTWQKAEEVPGTATLNQRGFAGIESVSCASAGNCSAGGYYTDGSAHQQAFVVSQTNGTWRNAEEVPGTATLNQRGNAFIGSVSCVSSGNCAAGGTYKDGSAHNQAFVVSQTNGTWQKAQEVPGTATLNRSYAVTGSVSCRSAGNCSAGGFYTGGSGQQAFVVSQTNGTWQKAQEVPGTATLNQAGLADVVSVSCASAGNCSAGGYYSDSLNHQEAFVVSQSNGTWQKAEEVPGTAALNQNRNAEIDSVSCAAAGNCSAGGYYTDGSAHQQAFLVGETNGTWQKAQEVPGTPALNQGGNAFIGSVSCVSVTNCGAGGSYTDGSGDIQAFVVNKT